MPGIFVDKQLFCQTFLYFVIFLLGFVIAIPIGYTMNKMSGLCLLYAEVIELSHEKLVDLVPGSRHHCNYAISGSIIFCMLYSVTVGVVHAYGIHINTRGATPEDARGDELDFVQGPIANAIILGANVLSGVFSFVAACMFSAGLSEFCNSLISAALGSEDPIHECSEGEIQIDWHGSGIGDGSSFASCMGAALFAQWSVFVLFMMQVGLNVMTVVKQIKARRGDDAHDTATLMIINAIRQRMRRGTIRHTRSSEVRAHPMDQLQSETHAEAMERFYNDIYINEQNKKKKLNRQISRQTSQKGADVKF